MMTFDEVNNICNDLHLYNWSLNSDGTVDVDGNVHFYKFGGISKIPLNFGRVSGYFQCSMNELTSLEGSPSYVGGYFECFSNKLSNLIGCPRYVGGNFYISNNEILDFEGFPKHISGDIVMTNNPIDKIWRLFNNRNDIEFFNDCDPIRVDSIVLDRLNFFLEETGKKPVKYVMGYKII